MARSLSARRNKAKNKRLNVRIKHLTEALHTVVEKGFTDPKLLAELNTCKQEIASTHPLHKYRVRPEFLVTEAQFANLDVEASSPYEAITKAKQLYNSGADMDYWAGDQISNELDFTYGWNVEEIK